MPTLPWLLHNDRTPIEVYACRFIGLITQNVSNWLTHRGEQQACIDCDLLGFIGSQSVRYRF